ncbi:MAG: hypothetical protein ACLP2J_12505 [Acidimicrobiales bacterium]
MTLVVLVVILVVAWLVILGPSVLRRRSGYGDGVNSISHFHRQLRVLEHSGGQPIVPPAYRLHSPGGQPARTGSRYPDVAAVPVLSVVGADQLPRPALAFLGDDPVPGQLRGAGSSSRQSAVGRADMQSEPVGAFRPADPGLRSLARRRRRDTLTVLTLLVVSSFLIGFIPGAGMAWMATLIGALVLAAYVAMLIHMRSMAEERERKLHYLRPSTSRTGAVPGYGHGARGHDDNAGYELVAYGAGAYGEGDPYGDGAGIRDPAAYEASRYAHPARQAAAR